jgi:hypothetical protein
VHARADPGGGDDGDVVLPISHCEAVWRGPAARPSSL